MSMSISSSIIEALSAQVRPAIEPSRALEPAGRRSSTVLSAL